MSTVTRDDVQQALGEAPEGCHWTVSAGVSEYGPRIAVELWHTGKGFTKRVASVTVEPSISGYTPSNFREAAAQAKHIHERNLLAVSLAGGY